MKQFLRALALLIAVLLIGCRPTPEKEIVINRSDDLAGQRISASAAPASADPVTFPKRWTESLRAADATLSIDAEIVTSGQQTFPVRTVKRIDFPLDALQRLSDFFFPDVVSWHEGFAFTREDFDAGIAGALRLGEALGIDLSDYLQYLSERRKATALSDDDYHASERFEVASLPCVAEILLQDGHKASIFVSGRDAEFHRYAWAGIHDKKTVELDGSFDGDPTRTIVPSLSLEEAVSVAEAFFEQVQLPDFQLCEQTEARYIDCLSSEERSTGWQMKFVRSYEYAPFNVSERDGDLWHGEVPFNLGWASERLELYVSDRGVEHLLWLNPLEVTGVANENVSLLPFSELQSTARNLIRLWLAGKQFSLPTVLTKMVLSTSVQPVKDSRDEAYLMPVWVFVISVYPVDFETQKPDFSRELSPLVFGLNAIDGTRQNMSGYY